MCLSAIQTHGNWSSWLAEYLSRISLGIHKPRLAPRSHAKFHGVRSELKSTVVLFISAYFESRVILRENVAWALVCQCPRVNCFNYRGFVYNTRLHANFRAFGELRGPVLRMYHGLTQVLTHVRREIEYQFARRHSASLMTTRNVQAELKSTV